MASWWVGFNSIGEDIEKLAETMGRKASWVLDCRAMYLECPEEHKLRDRLTDGINKKLYLEQYIRITPPPPAPPHRPPPERSR